MTSIQIGISGASIIAVIIALLKIMLSDRDKRLDNLEEDTKNIRSVMATKEEVKDHKDSLRLDMSEMKGDIKLILNHILGRANEN